MSLFPLPDAIELFTKEFKLPAELRAIPYDINSVLHFEERDYSKNGHRTIIFKVPIISSNYINFFSFNTFVKDERNIVHTAISMADIFAVQYAVNIFPFRHEHSMYIEYIPYIRLYCIYGVRCNILREPHYLVELKFPTFDCTAGNLKSESRKAINNKTSMLFQGPEQKAKSQRIE